MNASSQPSITGKEDAMTSPSASVTEWVDRLGRVGQTAHGVVYTLVGVIALEAAAGVAGPPTGAAGAFVRIARASGRPLLAVLMLGLITYAVWQGFRAVANPDDLPDDLSGWWRRLGRACTACAYVAVTVAAARAIVQPTRRVAEDAVARQSTAVALAAPYGRWLLVLIGVGIVVGGGGILWQGWCRRHEGDIDRSAVTRPARQWLAVIRRVGYSARGVVLVVIGMFVVLAAFTLDPSRVRGFGGALRELQAFPWLLGAIACGLVTYGVYEIGLAWLRRPPAGRAAAPAAGQAASRRSKNER
jgi:hypothetical protein